MAKTQVPKMAHQSPVTPMVRNAAKEAPFAYQTRTNPVSTNPGTGRFSGIGRVTGGDMGPKRRSR